ncbi:MAG: hypothetical protein IKE55_09405 [Kiritimatiellae bacterium]|nr:hypothetical protein [Kiritimatiellia bacterium]
MLPSFFDETVTVTRAPLATVRGSQVRDWANAESHAVAGCTVQPSTTSRDFEGRAGQASDEWRLYAPPGADVQAGDRIGCGGRDYEVDGVPYVWKSPTGRVTHMQARLVEWRG